MKRENPDDQDAAWQAIVANYGDRAALEPEEAPVAPEPAPPDWLEATEGGDDDAEDHVAPDPESRFVPPIPPPIPRPPLDRLLAWLGVFGAPAVLLFFVVTGIDIPRPLGWLLVGGFIAGFCYLVVKMPGSPRDPWDDGAVV